MSFMVCFLLHQWHCRSRAVAAVRQSARRATAVHGEVAPPWVVPFVATALAQSKDRYAKSIGEARLMVGNAIRMMARAPKSRAGCHFAAAIGLRSTLEGFAPEIPDYALDMHTMKGKAMGRGLDHFRAEGAKLVPPPTADDPYEDEAYRLWAIKQQGK
jgi:hypothetical protein